MVKTLLVFCQWTPVQWSVLQAPLWICSGEKCDFLLPKILWNLHFFISKGLPHRYESEMAFMMSCVYAFPVLVPRRNWSSGVSSGRASNAYKGKRKFPKSSSSDFLHLSRGFLCFVFWKELYQFLSLHKQTNKNKHKMVRCSNVESEDHVGERGSCDNVNIWEDVSC